MKHLILALFLFPLFVNGQGFPKKPTNYVTTFDPFYTNKSYLSKKQEEALNAKLRAFEDSTSSQLFIYITGGLYANDLEDYSREIFNTWGIGQKDKNNGILIAIFIEDRQYRIQVGYGLEAALPSDLCKQIQDEHMGPHFKKADYFEGINAGVDQLIFYSRHEYRPPSAFEQMKIPIIVTFLVGIILLIINLSSLKKWSNQPKRKQKYLILGILFLVIPMILAIVINSFQTEAHYLMIAILLGSFAELLLCIVINDKGEVRYDYESDAAYERRMREQAARESSSSDSSSDSGSGGGGSSGSGGSSSSW
ncbi:MAG: TPM domain-containing protein [Bacteroidetes bacterium]|nr:TPM domain-containing protein [Bacteroidota bacterium]